MRPFFAVATSLLAVAFSLSLPAFAADESLNDIDRQRAFVDRFNQDLEKEQLKKEAERQAEEKRLLALKRRRDEARISAQFAGLSGTLSGLPELPSFEGKFETLALDERPTNNG